MDDVASTTYLALVVVLGGAKKIIENKKALTAEEAKTVGRALGWIALTTAGKELDPLKVLIDAADEAALSKGKTVEVAGEDPTAVEVSGGKRRKRMRGGFPPVMSIMLGAIGVLFGGSTASTLYNLKTQQDQVREAAKAQLRAACPSDLMLGAPAKPLVDWSGEYAVTMAEYTALKARCDAVTAVVTTQVATADAALDAAWKKVPAQVQTLSTAAALVVAGPVSPATLGASAAVGAAMRQVVEATISGALPTKAEDLKELANTIAKGFPAPPPPAPPAPPAGGRRRKTRKGRKATKRRVTRRLVFSY